MHDAGTTFRDTSYEDLSNPDDYLARLEEANKAVSDRDLQEVVDNMQRFDREVSNLLTHTTFISGSNEAGSNLQEAACSSVLTSSGYDALSQAIFESPTDDNSDSKESFLESFKGKLKKSTLRNIFRLRYTALRESDQDVKNAFDPNARVLVDSEKVVKLFVDAKQKFTHCMETLREKAHSPRVKINLNKLLCVGVSLLAMNGLLSSCNNANGQNQATQPVQTEEVDKAPVQKSAPQAQQKVTVATEYSDSLGISERAWQSTISFANNSFTQQLDDSTTVSGYEYAYMRLTDDVMKNFKDGTTREQVLDAYRYLRSMYPNPEKLGDKGIDSTVLEAAKKAQEMDQYFNGCSEKFPENAAIIMVDQVVGNLNKRATGIDEPCDKDNVRYVSTRSASRHTSHATKVVQEVVEEADTTSQIVVPTDTANVVINDDFDSTQTNVVDRPVYFTQTTEAELDIEKRKGNDVSNGNFEGKATAKEALATEGESYNIVYSYQSEGEENDDDDFDIVARSVEQRTFDASVSDQEDVAVVQGTNSDGEVMDVVLNVDEEDYSNVTDTLATSSEISVSKKAPSSSDDDVDKKVVIGIEEVEIGTPSAGYVAERGGYNNSGLSEKQIERTKKTLGDTYDNIIENSPDEWFNRGGLAEGWTREELAYAVADWVHWQPSNPSLKAIVNYVNCDKEIANVDQVRQDLDRVCDNMTISGIDGNRKIKLRGATITCKDVRVTKNRGGAPFPGHGNKLPRLFMIETPVGFNESARVVNRIEVIKVPVEGEPYIDLLKGNDVDNGIFERKATAKEAMNTEAPNISIRYGLVKKFQRGH